MSHPVTNGQRQVLSPPTRVISTLNMVVARRTIHSSLVSHTQSIGNLRKPSVARSRLNERLITHDLSSILRSTIDILTRLPCLLNLLPRLGLFSLLSVLELANQPFWCKAVWQRAYLSKSLAKSCSPTSPSPLFSSARCVPLFLSTASITFPSA